MKYIIPAQNIEKLQKKVKHIQNKGCDVTFNILGETTIDDPKIKNLQHKAYEVEVEGKYIIDGWIFVATIEHTENGNIIRCVQDYVQPHIPEKYRTCGPECEHCHRIRDRKDTYLVYHDDTIIGGDEEIDEFEEQNFKQVGRSCLKEYTGGLDATKCAEIATILKEAENLQYYDWDDSFNSVGSCISNKTVKQVAYNLVKSRGYQRDITRNVLSEILFGNEEDLGLATDKELKEVDNWLSTKDTSNDYMYNCSLAWNKRCIEYRDFNLILSLLSIYFKEQKEKLQGQSTNYVGQIGDKIEINIKSYKLLYQGGFKVSYNIYSNTYTYQIIDDDGNTYIWKAHKEIDRDKNDKFIEPKKLKGTIKDHKEYHGIKQTILSNCKVTEYKEFDTSGISSTSDAIKVLDDIADEYLD